MSVCMCVCIANASREKKWEDEKKRVIGKSNEREKGSNDYGLRSMKGYYYYRHA